jgi:predicted NACHT family NTPase
MSSDSAVSTAAITQTAMGDRNIFTGTGDVNVVYNLPQAEAEDRRGLLILLDRVNRFWVKSVLEQSVQHEALINLGKETQPGAVEHPWEQVLELPNAASQQLAPDTRVADVFEQVGRLLLILGEPGSGKTITLLELARDLLDRARRDPSQPVPVIFNLSSWNEKFGSLSEWLTAELGPKYFIARRFGRRWLAENRLLLLLDGLDEVQADRRAACIRAINAFLENKGTPGLVVCSRLAEYTAEPARLKMNGAICLQPLTPQQVDHHLAQFGSELGALRTTLDKDQVLQDLARSPLMLSVMTLACQGASINALAGEATETPEARRAEIFETYIARMFARKGKMGSAHTNEQASIWLSWLAHNMQRHGQTIFLIEQMQPSWLNNIRQISIYLLSSRLAAVLLYGLLHV